MIKSKPELREKYLKVRKEILNKKEVSLLTFNKVYNLDEYKKARIVALFSSMKDEIDTTSFAINCLKDHKIMCYLKVIKGGVVEFYKVNSLDELVTVGPFKIKEPKESKINLIKPNDIDLMVMPGICFDLEKNRVGFGKGYYDRYLKNNKNIFKLVVTFDELIISDEIAVDSYDVKVDKIVT